MKRSKSTASFEVVIFHQCDCKPMDSSAQKPGMILIYSLLVIIISLAHDGLCSKVPREIDKLNVTKATINDVQQIITPVINLTKPSDDLKTLIKVVIEDDDNETSDSMLKLTHQELKSLKLTKPINNSDGQALDDRKTGKDSTSLSNYQNNNNKINDNQSNSNKTSTSSAKSRANKLKLFMINPVQSKISLTSLLPQFRRPVEQSASSSGNPNNQAQKTTATPSPTTQIGPSNKQLNPFAGEELDESSLEAFLQDSINHGQTHPPVDMSSFHPPPPPPQTNPALLLPPPQMAHLFPFRHPQHLFAQQHPQAPLMNAQHFGQLPRPPGGDPFDQAATQSNENYQKIGLAQMKPQMNFQNNNGGQMFGQDSAGDPRFGAGRSTTTNTSSNLHQSSSAAAALSHAAAAALLTERAKNLINHIQRGQAFPMAANSNSNNNNNVRNNRDTSSLNHSNNNNNGLESQQQQQNSAGKLQGQASNDMGLVRMIKSAAEAWAGSANLGAQVANNIPAVVVEHNGPTLTTVDFGNGANLLANNNENNPPEDEDEATFYSQEEDSESEGSNEAKRIAKMRHQQRHPFDRPYYAGSHQVDPATLDFYGNMIHNQALQQRYRQPLPIRDQSMQDFENFDKSLDHRPNGNSNNNNNHNQRYPDSINAIKEQNNQMKSSRDKSNVASNIKDKLASSNNEQIEQLIKELQDLNKRKKQQNGGDDRKTSMDDYEDLLGDSDEEDERIKVLRKKLLARLRSKTSRKRGIDSAASSSFSGEAIKIPLHALLLAALDRRMSPSEQSGGTVIQELISDDRNRDLIALGQQDFNEMTADLGSILNTTQLYESLTTTPSPPVTNMLSLSYVDQRQLNRSTSDPMDPDARQLPTAEPLRLDQTGEQSANVEDIQSEYTTRVPVTAKRPKKRQRHRRQKGRRDVSTSDEGDFDVDKHIENYIDDNNEQALEPSWAQSGNKQSGQQKRDGSTGRQQGGTSVEFDDDYDEMAGNTRRKILKRRRPAADTIPAYEANEAKFFDTIQKDTSSKIDLDKDIANLEGPSESSRESRVSRSRRNKRRRPARDGNDEEGDESVDFDGDHDDESEGNERPSGSSQIAKVDQQQGEPEQHEEDKSGAGSSTPTTTWRPSMIDEEVRKIEELAKEKRGEVQKPDQEAENEGEGESEADSEEDTLTRRMDTKPNDHHNVNNEPPNQNNKSYEETSETNELNKTAERPDGPIVKLIIDSPINGNTSITQQIADDPHLFEIITSGNVGRAAN